MSPGRRACGEGPRNGSVESYAYSDKYIDFERAERARVDRDRNMGAYSYELGRIDSPIQRNRKLEHTRLPSSSHSETIVSP